MYRAVMVQWIHQLPPFSGTVLKCRLSLAYVSLHNLILTIFCPINIHANLTKSGQSLA